MAARIVIIAGPDRGRSFVLVPGVRMQVGRSQTSDTKLDDPTVSRLHCEITYDGKAAVLVNHSRSGTLVNGTPTTEQELHHGDVIHTGATQFRFQVVAMEESDTLLHPAN